MSTAKLSQAVNCYNLSWFSKGKELCLSPSAEAHTRTNLRCALLSYQERFPPLRDELQDGICSPFGQAQSLKQPAWQCPFPGIYSALFFFFPGPVRQSRAAFFNPGCPLARDRSLVPCCQRGSPGAGAASSCTAHPGTQAPALLLCTETHKAVFINTAPSYLSHSSSF